MSIIITYSKFYMNILRKVYFINYQTNEEKTFVSELIVYFERFL